MIRDVIEQAAASNHTDRGSAHRTAHLLTKEITRTERYHDAFENGDLDPTLFKQRLSALDARPDTLHGQDQALAHEIAAGTPTAPDTATLEVVADELARVVATGDTDQAKALLRILIAELQVNSRAEILPTYRVGAPVVCAQISSVEPVRHNANHYARLPGGRMSLGEANSKPGWVGSSAGVEHALQERC